MKITVTVDIFSGRTNPSITLSGREASKLIDSLQVQSPLRKNNDRHLPEPANLGFRGILLEQSGAGQTDSIPSFVRITPDRMYGASNVSAALTDNEFEKLIFDQLAKMKDLPKNKAEFRKILQSEINTFRKERLELKLPLPKFPDIILPKAPCTCSPGPDLAWWNGSIKPYNNCYNYATNYRTDTFAQPGRASSTQYTSLAGCSVAAGQTSARQGAVADGLIGTPLANNQCPKTGHLVALVIWPGYDFHWYRKGSDGKWSHKPGGTAATLLDNSNNPIADPRTANRGGYTQFCTFMQVIDGHIKIK